MTLGADRSADVDPRHDLTAEHRAVDVGVLGQHVLGHLRERRRTGLGGRCRRHGSDRTGIGFARSRPNQADRAAWAPSVTVRDATSFTWSFLGKSRRTAFV